MTNEILPRVDVVILSWNRTEETLAAIDSALAQKGVAITVLILDQGSEAANFARLEAHVAGNSAVKVRRLERNVGVPRGRNIATAMGNAPYVVALDNDALFDGPAVLARTVRRFEDEPRLGTIAYRILNHFTDRDDPMCWDYPAPFRSLADTEFATTRFVGAGHAHRRAAFEQAGGYDEALFFCGEERELAYRILNLGYGMRYIGDLVVRHKSDPEARQNWDGTRYYYTVRNALYTDYKYGRSRPRLALAIAALTAKGCRNGCARQAVQGVRDAWAMTRDLPPLPLHKISPNVRNYIERCEAPGRGTLLQRITRQFHRLPGAT